MSDSIVWNPPPFSKTQCGTLVPEIQSYAELYQWSIDHTELFWKTLLTTQNIIFEGSPDPVISPAHQMWPTPIWFPNVRLNFAQNLLQDRSDNLAVRFISETEAPLSISFQTLFNRVQALAHWMRALGIKKGDCVAGVLSNCPEALIGMLASSSVGAIWTVCSPDLGADYILDRFVQTRPKLLISMHSYSYGGDLFSLQEKNKQIQAHLPDCLDTLYVGDFPEPATTDSPLIFESMAFSDPLYILFSSGTTGKPKAIVHSIGGTLIQHIKEHRFQCNIYPGEKLLYYTTTSWMMWHWMMSALASQITIILFDGKPDPERLWKIVEQEKVTAFGTSAPWLSICQKTKIKRNPANLSMLKLLLSTGAPLLKEQFDYILHSLSPHLQIASISGGTDIVSCFAGGGPVPVIRGRLQCLGLGMKVEVWNEAGQAIRNQPGELVCTAAFPCMPIYFLEDTDHSKYHSAYFEKYTGVWAHGDDAILYDDNTVEILGRSDTTIKRNGVRIGTSDIYNALSGLTFIEDSLAVGKRVGDNEEIFLFIKCKPGQTLDPKLKKEIRLRIMAQSVWLKPDRILAVSDIPYTSNGKKSEQLIKNILNGKPISNLQAIRNPECLAQYSHQIAV